MSNSCKIYYNNKYVIHVYILFALQTHIYTPHHLIDPAHNQDFQIVIANTLLLLLLCWLLYVDTIYWELLQ
jgi:acetyltransferase-like isoleucine patch superfamily enzyme